MISRLEDGVEADDVEHVEAVVVGHLRYIRQILTLENVNPVFCFVYFFVILFIYVVVVYQCTISNVMVALGRLKLFCRARFTLC